MRYEVRESSSGWSIYVDRSAPLAWLSKDFPDAEKIIKDQCLFLNESPAMKAA